MTLLDVVAWGWWVTLALGMFFFVLSLRMGPHE